MGLAKSLKEWDDELLSAAQNDPNWRHIDVPVEVLSQLARTGSYYAKQLIARYPKTPIEALEHLLETADSSTKLDIVANPNATPEILDQIAKDDYYWCRYHVARHPNTSVKTLINLAGDFDAKVRTQALNNPKLVQYQKENAPSS
jgi:hypothetical protein